MDIRRATSFDSDAIFALVNQLHDSISVARIDFLSTLSELLQRQDSICLVGIVDAEVVGYISGCIHPVLIQGGNFAFIDEIVVRSEARGRGDGTALMAELERIAKQRNCSAVGLATGGAKLFYERIGYQSRAGYYKKRL